uniref:Uncharacterized protein n=1 Tax=Anguilla anguilla TaxID=7936 RepID=A0A0E9UJ58_ANGAN
MVLHKVTSVLSFLPLCSAVSQVEPRNHTLLDNHL